MSNTTLIMLRFTTMHNITIHQSPGGAINTAIKSTRLLSSQLKDNAMVILVVGLTVMIILIVGLTAMIILVVGLTAMIILVVGLTAMIILVV